MLTRVFHRSTRTDSLKHAFYFVANQSKAVVEIEALYIVKPNNF